MPDLDNRRRGRAWREQAAMYLRGQGLDAAEPRSSTARKMMDAVIEPSILGVPGGWFLETHSDLSPNWGSSLDSAEASAALGGFEKAAVIQYRRQLGVDRSFVLMSLDTFTRAVLQKDASEWKSLQEFESVFLNDQMDREE